MMRISCNNCGNYWEIYARDNWKDDKARQCPHCFAEIRPELWERMVLPAFGAAQDCNRELYLHSKGYDEPLFRIDFVADQIPDARQMR